MRLTRFLPRLPNDLAVGGEGPPARRFQDSTALPVDEEYAPRHSPPVQLLSEESKMGVRPRGTGFGTGRELVC
jgi:hypothetical protein